MPENQNLNSHEFSAPSPEKAPPIEDLEQKVESRPARPAESQVETAVPSAPPVLPTVKTVTADQTGSGEIVLKKVENILAGGLENIYLTLDPQQQQVFREQGEETGRKIVKLLQSAKVSAGKIIALIINWLRIIPRVNRHYLEQEAKIKARQIMDWYANRK